MNDEIKMKTKLKNIRDNDTGSYKKTENRTWLITTV